MAICQRPWNWIFRGENRQKKFTFKKKKKKKHCNLSKWTRWRISRIKSTYSWNLLPDYPTPIAFVRFIDRHFLYIRFLLDLFKVLLISDIVVIPSATSNFSISSDRVATNGRESNEEESLTLPWLYLAKIVERPVSKMTVGQNYAALTEQASPSNTWRSCQ